MGLIIDPVAILLSATGGQNKRVLILKTAENMGVRMAVQKGETSTVPNLCRIIRSREDSALCLHLFLDTP